MLNVANANLARQWLLHAAELSRQSQTDLGNVGQNANGARGESSQLSSDVYSAGSDTEETDSSGIGQTALQRLNTLSGWKAQTETPLTSAGGRDQQLGQAIATALSLAGQLGVPDVESWFVTNPINSAAYERQQAATRISETVSHLNNVGWELESAQRLASSVAGDGPGQNVGIYGEQLYGASSGIGSGFSEVSTSSSWGANHNGSAVSYLQQATRALDELEAKYSTTF